MYTHQDQDKTNTRENNHITIYNNISQKQIRFKMSMFEKKNCEVFTHLA